MAGEKILIIEDEYDIAMMVDTLLKGQGYQTFVAQDGLSGLELALKERPDVILLDLRLPQMSGMQLLYKLHEHQANVQVVVVTAWGSEELAVQALRMGVKDYIKKPFNLDELLQVIERTLEKSQLRRERDKLTAQLLVSNQQLTQRVRQITALYEVGRALASTLDLDELLKVILSEACRVLEVKVASIWLLDKHSGELVFRSGSGGMAGGLLGQRLAPGCGVAGWVAERGVPLLAPHVESDPRFSPIFDCITGFQTESILCVPLIIKEQVIGVVEALNKPQAGFTEDDLAMLRSLAASAAVAIENTQLFKETKRRLRESRVLFQLGKQLTTLLPPRELLRTIVNGAVELVPGAERSIIYLYETSGNLKVCASSSEGLSNWDALWEPTIKRRIVNRALKEHHVIAAQIFQDTQRDEPGAGADACCSAILAVPLRVQEKDLGVLTVDSEVKQTFTADDQNILSTFANQAAIAIENTRLYQNLRESRDQVTERSAALEKRLSELTRLQKIALELGKLTVGADLQDVYKRLTKQAATLLEVKSSAILLFEPENKELVCREPAFGVTPDVIRDYRIPLHSNSPIWHAWENGQPLMINDVAASPLVARLGLSELAARQGLKASMFSILKMGGHSVGAFQVSDKQDGSAFTPDDQRILEIFASQSAIAIENARLFTREKQRASEMETLVEIAQAVTKAVTEHPRAVLERIVRGACEVMRADCAVVYPFVAQEPGVCDVSNAAAFGTRHRLMRDGPAPALAPIHLIRQRNPLTCEDVTCEPPELLTRPFIKSESIQAFVAVLLEADEQELGVLYVNFRNTHRFQDHELTTVRLIAHQAALAIAKSRLFETLNQDLFQTNTDLRRKLRETEQLRKIINMISSTLDIEQVFDGILEGAISITGAPQANILTMDEQSDVVVSHMRRAGQTVTEKIDPNEMAIMSSITQGQETLLTRDTHQPPADHTPWTSIYRRIVPDSRSFLYVPIMSGSEQKRVGLLGIGSPHPGQFGDDDRRLLEALANQATIAIQNARRLQALRVYQEQQIEAERIAAIADVAVNMVHRINNTVGAIRPLIQQIELRLKRGQLDDGYLQEKLLSIRESADHTLDVARQIRRPFQSTPLQPVDVNASIAAACADLKTPVGVSLEVDYADLPLVKATHQLDEVFRNLIKNAMDAMAKGGGTLLVRSRCLNDQLIIVTVQDDGPGIPPELREKIFHMGTTTKPGGMGFGLWWSRMFLRRLGGDMTLHSHQGQGCTFTVTLPINGTMQNNNLATLP